MESPPTFGDCNAPISVMSTLSIDSKGAKLVLSNATSTKAQDSLIFDLIVNGERRLVWTPAVLRPGTAVTLSVQFLKTVESPIILLCQNRPIGIVDDPQPVVGVIVDPPDTSTELP